jgi:hypothetical protein
MTQKTDSQQPSLAEKRAAALRDNLKRRKDQLKQRETASDAKDTKPETEKP